MTKDGSSKEGGEQQRALEVSAIFAESIITLKHLIGKGHSRKSPLLTRSLLIGAALLLALSALSFVKGVQLAAANEDHYRAHLADEKIAHEFRPGLLPAEWEWLGIGGGALGLLLATLGIARKREDEHSDVFRVGSDAGADYLVTLARGLPYDLARISESGKFRLQIPEHWHAEFVESGGPYGARAAPKGFRSWALPDECEALVRSGDHRFRIRSVTPPRKQALPILASIDSRFLAHLGGTSVLVLGMMSLLDTHFDDQQTLYSELFALAPRISDYRIPAKEKPIPTPAFANGVVPGPIGGTGQAMAGPAAAMGAKRAEQAAARYSIARKQPEPQLARGRAMADARKAGLLGLLRKDPFMASAAASGAFSSGLDDDDVYGGMLGTQVGEMAGAWGYSIAGVGTSGGGNGWGTIGSGNYGTLGHGSGTGDGWGAGHGTGMHGHDVAAPGVRAGNADAIGSLDKNIIRRYIRRKLPRIQYCFEKALLADGNLEGSVNVVFQITPGGEVQSASASGVENEEMHECIVSAIRSIQFPKPRDSGYVAVRYPFTFVSVQ